MRNRELEREASRSEQFPDKTQIAGETKVVELDVAAFPDREITAPPIAGTLLDFDFSALDLRDELAKEAAPSRVKNGVTLADAFALVGSANLVSLTPVSNSSHTNESLVIVISPKQNEDIPRLNQEIEKLHYLTAEGELESVGSERILTLRNVARNFDDSYDEVKIIFRQS